MAKLNIILKTLAWKVIPWPLTQWWVRRKQEQITKDNFRYDEERFVSYSSTHPIEPGRSAQLISLITMDYHRLEKGLALPTPKPDFGTDVARRLVQNLNELETLGICDATTGIALRALEQFLSHRRSSGYPMEGLEKFCNSRRSSKVQYCGGTVERSRQQVLDATNFDSASFFKMRHSIRDFAATPVSLDLIREAVSLARRSPSVCNRQSGRVHCIADPHLKSRLLECQNGNRGFGESIDKLLLVTSDLQSFVSAGERNQCWIDGGMFAMSVVYALHSLGLGSCCLNWSVTKEKDRQLREVFELPDHEVLIMMIAVGHLRERFRVALSTRKSVCEILSEY